jgi:predicted ATP-binding protein involved in virulence
VQINKLFLKNFDGFEQSEFEFNPHFNLLIGENASGKSSVIDALSIALGTWFLGIRGYSSVPGIEASQVRVVAYQHQDSWSFEKQFPSRIKTQGILLGKELTWARELRGEGGKTTSVDAKDFRAAAEEAASAVRSGKEITLPLICAYGTERLWFEATHRKRKPGETAKLLPSRLDGYRDCIDFTIQESSLLNWFSAEVSASQQRKTETIALRTVKSAIVGCVEGAKTLYYDERYKDLVVDMKRFGHQMFKNLSDGQRIVLTLIGDLAKRATTLNPDLGEHVLEKTPGVVLIDELDLHLHPTWQRHVIGDLKRTFPAVQFITTTHSPQLIGEALPEETIRLDKQAFGNPPQTFGMDSNWVLEHVQGADAMDPAVKAYLREIEDLIDELRLDEAQAVIDRLRTDNGPRPELVRFSARIARLLHQRQ